MTLTVGSIAPNFSLPIDETQTLSLEALRGKHVVLYFYPKDDTPGCTREACDFRDALPSFDAKDVEVVGISPDGVDAHAKFKAKYELPFKLAADQDKSVCQLYGVWKEKNMYGKKTMGVERTTFLIDREGTITHIWPKVKVEGHVDAILQALKP